MAKLCGRDRLFIEGEGEDQGEGLHAGTKKVAFVRDRLDKL
jgi:hypothetical protein